MAKLKTLLAIAAAVQQSGLDVTTEQTAEARAASANNVEIHDTVLIAKGGPPGSEARRRWVTAAGRCAGPALSAIVEASRQRGRDGLMTMQNVALRAAARRPEPPWMLSTEPAPVTATADDSRFQAAVTIGMQDTAEHEMAKPPGTPGSAVDQTEYVFHELHADGCNAHCGVCDSQYWH